MSKVYLVLKGGYESVEIYDAYSTREKAQERVDYLTRGREHQEFLPFIEEMELDRPFEQLPIPEGKRDYEVTLSRFDPHDDWVDWVFDGEDEESRTLANEGHVEAVVIDGYHWRFRTWVWAESEDEASQIAFKRLDELQEQDWRRVGS